MRKRLVLTSGERQLDSGDQQSHFAYRVSNPQADVCRLEQFGRPRASLLDSDNSQVYRLDPNEDKRRSYLHLRESLQVSDDHYICIWSHYNVCLGSSHSLSLKVLRQHFTLSSFSKMRLI